MPSIVDDMRSAGFSDDTIGSWANEQKPAMKQAGFDDATIEGYFSGLKAPGTIPRPFLNRFKGWLDAAAEGAKAGFGEEPLGPSPEDTARLRASGIYDNGTGNAAVRGLRIANETVIPAAVTAVGGLFRGFNAALMGAGALGGQLLSEATGGNEADQERARRDMAHLVVTGAMLGGTVAPISKAPKIAGPGASDLTIGQLPTAEDFTAATKIVAAPPERTGIRIRPIEEPAPAEAAPIDHAPAQARAKIVSLYEDHGIHPAEIAADVKENPEIARAILSDDPKELPQAYIDAYHGSPYSFDKFDVTKIGTGEGAQSYGHGLYFAENPKVAGEYADRLYHTREENPDGSLITDPRAMVYGVRINANQSHFLDWDKPFVEQSQHVQDAITKLAKTPEQLQLVKSGLTLGEGLKLGHLPGSFDINSPEFSKLYSDAGIPGIKYLDQGSRKIPSQIDLKILEDGLHDAATPADAAQIRAEIEAAKKEIADGKANGTRNFVVFDDKHVEITHKNGNPVAAALDAAEAIKASAKPNAAKSIPEYSPDKVIPPQGKLQPAGHFMFPAEQLNVDANRFQFKSDGDANGVNKALSGVTQWDTSKSGGVIVWEQKDGKMFVADGHQRTGLARRLVTEGHAPINIPGVLYREIDGVKAEDARAIAASANIANGSGSALDGAKVLRSRPELIDGTIPLSTGKGKQAVALAKLNDEAFGLVVNEVVPENYGAVVGELIPTDGARQVAALKAIARFEPRNVDEAAALVNRVKAAELAKADAGAQGSMFGDLETAESTAGEEMKIVGRAIADLKKDKTLFGRVVANAERIEQTGSKIEQENAKSVATDAEKFARILASDAYSAGPIRTVLVAAAKDLKNGHASIGESAARVVAALRGETENAVANRDGTGGRAKAEGDGKPTEPAPGTYHKPVEEAGLVEPGADGKPQGLIPGVEPVKPTQPKTIKEQLIEAANKPMEGGDRAPDGLFGNSMNEPELFDKPKPRDIFSDAAARAEGQDILDGPEGGRLTGLSADVANDPFTDTPRGLLPPGRLVNSLREIASKVTSIWHDIQMNTVPMALGVPETRAVSKDFANATRRVQYEWSRQDDAIVKNFSAEDRARMWSASDEESVALQLGESREHQGLVTLNGRMRAVVEALQTRAQAVWVMARDLGMVQGEGLPSYTPRMLINIVTSEGRTARALNEIGTNVRTTTNRLKHRAHMMDYETERAGKDRFGENVELARDIRALPLATAELERAVVGRQLIADIKEIGQRAGIETVAEGSKPTDGSKWFTIDNPAFKVWRPKLEQVDGKWQTVKDAAGNIIFEKTDLYVHGDFEGPLRAVMGQRAGATYKASMELKAKTMSVIMNSPLIHNAVEYGRAFLAMPGRMMTFRVYRDGAKAIADMPTMREAIDHGLVPIGNRGYIQDITGMMEAPELKAGRSTTAQVLAYVPELFNPNAGLAVKNAIDKAGNFWHNTMLWDQVAKLQAGLYTNFRDDLIAKGTDEATAKYIAAHQANRYAGALPKEAMSHSATAWANFLLFSRSFTMGNLGVMKDMLTGLPRDVLAQIERDVGTVDGRALSDAKSLARRKAVAIVIGDIVIYHVANSLFQSMINVISGRKDTSEEAQGYADRLKREANRVQDDPTALLHPFAMMENLSSTSENEPDKRNRIYVGKTKDGTAIYARFPFGKIGEEFEGFMSSPLQMLHNKEGTLFRPLMQAFANDKGFGRKVYNPYAEGYGELANNIGLIAAHIAKAQTPESQVRAGYDLATGQGDSKLNVLQALGPLSGITFSKGAPGGPAIGEMYREQAMHKYKVDARLADWRRDIQNGKPLEAIAEMTKLGVPKGLQQFYIRTSLEPGARMTGRSVKDFYLTASPETRARFEDSLKMMGR